jgi:hypothetical protein
MDCLLIAAVPPSSGRRKHGQLHASRVQARSSHATRPTYRSTSHWLCGGRMADDVFDSAILEQADHTE